MNKNKITIAVTSAILSGYLYAGTASAASNDIVEWVPGQTEVVAGQMVSYEGKCYVAKQTPGVWETPTGESWFWSLASCDGESEGNGSEGNGSEGNGSEGNGNVGGGVEVAPGEYPAYVAGTTYQSGDIVSAGNKLYQCKPAVAAWCSGEAWAYAPGTGSAWQQAWDIVGDTVTPEPPPVQPEANLTITAPFAGQLFTLGDAVNIQTRIEGELAAKVEFWVDNSKLTEKTVSPSQTNYSHAWTSTETGNATIRVVVLDKDGKEVKQQSVSVSITEEATEDFTAPVVNFVTPSNGATVNVGDKVSIAVNATDADKDLAKVVVKANNQEVCDFNAASQSQFSCDWTATQEGSVSLTAVATDAQNLSAQANVQITVAAEEEPPVTPPVEGELCKDFNVYPDWTNGNHALQHDIMVHNNVAYQANYYTTSIPGSDETWAHHLNCDGSAPGSAPVLSLRNPLDPVRLEVAGWPNTFVVASPSTAAPATLSINASTSDTLSDVAELTKAFAASIELAATAGSSTVIINSDVLDKATQNKDQFGVIAVKEALAAAAGDKIDAAAINALTDDLKGWVDAYALIMSAVAPQANFGWTLSIGDFAFANHSGRQSVWDKGSQFTSDLLRKLAIYKADSANKADFVAFTKSANTAALNSDQWHNALEYVKQVTDYVQAPAILVNIPTEQAANYFMGNTASDRQIRKAAFSNIFAIEFDKDSAELTSKIANYETAKVPLYYIGEQVEVGDLTAIPELNKQLLAAENAMNNDAFLYELPDGLWEPSSVYKWADFLDGLNAMHNIGVAGNKFWLLDPSADEATNIKYAKVAIAAFLAQSMQETIRYNACDENNWAMIEYGAAADYPMSASCGQLGQKYADYGVNPESGRDYAYSCPRDNKMEVGAITHAKWYGAPGPIFAAPDAVLEERGLLVNGSVGRWDFGGSWCKNPPERIDTSKQAWERDACEIYEGQRDGRWVWDGSSQESVEGCGWWGRGVIQTTGRQNFGMLNHYLGRSHVDPSAIGTTIDGVTVEAPPANPLYSGLDFCSNPGLICSSEENKEIKWIAGLFYWVTSVQAYSNEGGEYSDWNYYNELKNYVDNGMNGTSFIDAVSGIVNRGCPDSVCATGEVHNMEERRENFVKVLKNFGLDAK